MATNVNDLEVVKKTFKDMMRLMTSLYGRWLDEREYEDIDEYKKVIQQNMPKGFAVTKMTKRPWGCQFTYKDNTYSFQVTSTEYRWKKL